MNNNQSPPKAQKISPNSQKSPLELLCLEIRAQNAVVTFLIRDIGFLDPKPAKPTLKSNREFANRTGVIRHQPWCRSTPCKISTSMVYGCYS